MPSILQLFITKEYFNRAIFWHRVYNIQQFLYFLVLETKISLSKTAIFFLIERYRIVGRICKLFKEWNTSAVKMHLLGLLFSEMTLCMLIRKCINYANDVWICKYPLYYIFMLLNGRFTLISVVLINYFND